MVSFLRLHRIRINKVMTLSRDAKCSILLLAVCRVHHGHLMRLHHALPRLCRRCLEPALARQALSPNHRHTSAADGLLCQLQLHHHHCPLPATSHLWVQLESRYGLSYLLWCALLLLIGSLMQVRCIMSLWACWPSFVPMPSTSWPVSMGWKPASP